MSDYLAHVFLALVLSGGLFVIIGLPLVVYYGTRRSL